MKIYTKTGDLGETTLWQNVRLSKADRRIELLGALDELNCHLGVAASLSSVPALTGPLETLQHSLFDTGARLAQILSGKQKEVETDYSETIELWEKEIDQMTKELSPLKNFILPGGSPVASHLHLARAVCRRAEILLAKIIQEHSPPMPPQSVPIADLALPFSQKYLNRLSDYLFILARLANHYLKRPDLLWQPKTP
ncbi:MAG: cob(I)yrinic acid a,c-diamide adenosyltransferase [Pirellulaceae bacterium]|nr:cob(I)yrinic acid a,c-diamide adenosyltransferase [Pirellulaceae bacterium]